MSKKNFKEAWFLSILITASVVTYVATVSDHGPLTTRKLASIEEERAPASYGAILSNPATSETLKAVGVQPLAKIEQVSSILQFVLFETQANAVSSRNFHKFKIKHYEIPLSLLEKDIYKDVVKDLNDAMIFEKDGEKYVRWVINPEDTKWHLAVKQFLDKRGIDSSVHEYFDGHLTASRSLIAIDPQSGYKFSIKVSTNNTGGAWKDKKQTWEDAFQIRLISDRVMDTYKKMDTRHVILDEPFGLGIKELDQGLIIRSYNEIQGNDKYYVPGFSMVHEEMGKELAKYNGYTDPVKFVEDVYVRPLGEALAEFSAYTGLTFDSPHSQNFLVELDKDFHPTGRVVLRDVGDTYIFTHFLKGSKHAGQLAYMEKSNLVPMIRNSVGIMHGNQSPTWINDKVEQRWAKTFFKQFDKRFSEITKIPISDLHQDTQMQQGHYFSHNLEPSSSWNNYLKYKDCFMGAKKTRSGLKCPDWIPYGKASTHQCIEMMEQLIH